MYPVPPIALERKNLLPTRDPPLEVACLPTFYVLPSGVSEAIETRTLEP